MYGTPFFSGRPFTLLACLCDLRMGIVFEFYGSGSDFSWDPSFPEISLCPMISNNNLVNFLILLVSRLWSYFF